MGRMKKAISVLLALLMILCLLPTSFASAEDDGVETDPDLIGGLTVRAGSLMADASVKTKLQKLNLVMNGVGV